MSTTWSAAGTIRFVSTKRWIVSSRSSGTFTTATLASVVLNG